MNIPALLLAATLSVPQHVAHKVAAHEPSILEKPAITLNETVPVPPYDPYPYQYTPNMPQHIGVNVDNNICPPAIAQRCAADPQMYKVLRRSGVSTIRYTLYWGNVEPEQGRFDWSQPDAEIAAMREAGLHVYLNIAGAPAWVTGGKNVMHAFACAVPTFHDDGGISVRFAEERPECMNPPPFNLDAVEDIAEQVVRRYWSSVQWYGFGNEWEYPVFFPYGTRTDGLFTPDYDLVAQILHRFYDTVKSLDPRLQVHGPETSIAETLEEILKREDRQFVDRITTHTYGWTPDDYPASAIGQMDQMLDVVDRYGGRDMWITETGFASHVDRQGSMRDQASRVLEFVRAAEERDVQKVIFYRGQGSYGADYSWVVREGPERRNGWRGSAVLSKPVLTMLASHLGQEIPRAHAGCDHTDTLYDAERKIFVVYDPERLEYVPVP